MDDVEIDSIHNYDFRRARLSVSLKWLLSASLGKNIPVELREPLPLKDKDTVTAIYVNTGLVSLLVNSRLYNQACLHLFPQLSGSLQSGGHWPVIQALSRLGVYVEDDNGQAVTETDLVQTNPFHLTAHVSLIESIMTAYTYSTATTELVVRAVKSIGPFNASEDLPIDIEDGLLVWMNKVSAACVKHAQHVRHDLLANQSQSSSVRINKKQLSEVSGGSVPITQLMDDILKDISDACSLCTVISFYCPHQLNYSDIHIADAVGIGDSLHNISLVKKFCDNHLPTGIFHFTYEDILYSTDTIKPSLLAFITQLFYHFVINPLDIVSPPHISFNNNCNQAKTIPSSTAAKYNQSPVSSPVSSPVGSTSTNNQTNNQIASPHHTPQQLISDATKKSFQHAQPQSQPQSQSTNSSTLSNTADHYDSSQSLNGSSSATPSSRLLHKRSSKIADTNAGNGSMHDTLSPIVVRKSQSMGILGTPDPKQSLVAWDSKPYYVDRSRNQNTNRVSATSNGSISLLSNVSFHEGSDEDDTSTPSVSNHELSSANFAKDLPHRHQSKAQTHSKTADRTKGSSSSSNLMSNSYQRLLDRSNDLESPLKQFAQKHGFQLAQKPEVSSTESGDQTKSTSPEDVTSSEFTKITPRSDSELSPRPIHTEPRDTNTVGQSYVISTALTAEGAHAAGIPVIDHAVSDSCSDFTFTSLAEDEEGGDGELGSPIQPILLSSSNNVTPRSDSGSAVTSFIDMGMSENSTAEKSVAKIPMASPRTTGLKQRFEDQRSASPPDAKPAKKTTFSLNQTTWSDQVRVRSDSEADSDSISETSETSVDRKPFSDYKIRLEEKRKAMEKKKTLEEMERTKEMNTASRQAFLTAVTKNKNQPNSGNRSSDPLKAFNRNDISKTIENLQNKWQQDEKSNAKRAAVTTTARAINVTPAALDNITELSESMEVESPKVPLPSMARSEETETGAETKERRSSSIDLHETPVDVEQYGLDKLNASLSELKGEVKRLSDEQQRIEELQHMMRATRPQSRSTPLSKRTEDHTTSPLPSSTVENNESSEVFDPTLRLSDLDKSTSGDDSKWSTRPDIKNHDNFSHPNIQSMSQSTDQPFILHDTNKTSARRRSKASNSQSEDSKPNSTPKPGPMKRSDSNGFLSSSQLSRKKTPGSSSSPAPSPSPSPALTGSLNQSGGRRKWTASNTSLFPGYDDDSSDLRATSNLKEPDMATRDTQRAFQPPPEMETAASKRSSQKLRKSSTRRQDGSANAIAPADADELHIQQLPGHSIPQGLTGGFKQGGQHYTVAHRLDFDTPMRDPNVGQRLAADSVLDTPMREMGMEQRLPTDSVLDTPMREMGMEQRLPADSVLDTPMREMDMEQRLPADSVLDTPMRELQTYQGDFSYHSSASGNSQSNMSGLVALAPSPNQNLPINYPPPHGSHDADGSFDARLKQTYRIGDGRLQHAVYDDQVDTPLREHFAYRDSSNASQQGRRRPQSMIESIDKEHVHNTSMDSPIKEAMRRNPNGIFYSPPTRDKAPVAAVDHQSPLHVTMTDSTIDTPLRQHAMSRYGTTSITPQAVSRHGTVHTDQSTDVSGSSINNRLVRAPYEQVPASDKLTHSDGSSYKLTTPYGTADNEVKAPETNISLSSAMDAIRTDMIKQQNTGNANDNLAFTAISQSGYNIPAHPLSTEHQFASPHSSMSPAQDQEPAGYGQTVAAHPFVQTSAPTVPSTDRRISSGSSDMESAFVDIGSSHSQLVAQLSRPGSASHMAVPSLNRQQSTEHDDKASVHSYGSCSVESGDGTPRSNTKPKRPTWDMSTPQGDVLNQPGVGFIVAGQAKLSEEELIRRKEKVLLMQMKRREEQELKRQQKAAELAAKAEAERMKEQEVGRRKMEGKAKKEAILQQFQIKKAEEDLPPEMRPHFRQRKKAKRGERPASIHWAGSSVNDDAFLRVSDNLDSASSFTVSLASGNLAHRRPISPAGSSAAGSLSSRSKTSSRAMSTIEAPSGEYTGPKLYVKPSQKQKSNRTIIINAVSHCCLAGVVNTENKNRVLMELAKSDGKHFLILFRDGNQTYKAVYSYCPDSEECSKVYGQGPRYIKDEMCHRFYKYNSGGKNFTEVLSTKHLSVSIDAITIHNHLWQKKAGASSKR